MTSLAERVIPRLSQDELRVMAMPTIQLAMLGGDKGITIERRAKVPAATVKSLIARGLVKSKIDGSSRVMPLSSLGVQVNEILTGLEADAKYADEWQLRVPDAAGKTWPCGHPRTERNTMPVGIAGVRCRLCRRKINRKYGARVRSEAA